MSTALPLRTTPAYKATSSLFRDALHNCPESIAVIHQGRVHYANPAFARLFGYLSASELTGTPLASFLPPGHACEAESSAICGYPGCQFEGRRRDGSRSPMESSCALFHSEGRSFLVLSARDI